ncbi:MAG: hypothetical protein P9M00_06100 [Candidatus Tritonobacter lacicola]|nr:hypothetical protein [Candidatus Tritonobacter lacicola]
MMLELIVISHHEMWRDEMQAWLIARNSSSIYALFRNFAEEVHPALWFIMLYIVNFATRSPLCMQFLHVIIAVAIVYIFAYFSPFTRLQKALFPFGYMIFYELSVISRCYSTGILLIFVICCIYPSRCKRLIAMAILLFLLANSSFMGLVVAAAIGLSLIIEFTATREGAAASVPGSKKMVFSCIVFLGCLISAAQCSFPYVIYGDLPLNISGGIEENTLERSAEALFSPIYALFPIQFPKLQFWDTNVLCVIPPPLKIVISVIFITAISLVLYKNRTVLFIYLLSYLGMVALHYVYCVGFYRHISYQYIMILACLWMHRSRVNETGTGINNRIPNMSSCRIESAIVSFLLGVQVLCTITPVSVDMARPFSAGKEAAKWIKDSGMDQWTIVGYPHAAITPVIGYLDRELYDPVHEKFLSAPGVTVDGDFAGRVSPDTIIRKLLQLKEECGPNILLILNKPLDDALLVKYPVVEATRFNGTICESEQFYIYILQGIKKGWTKERGELRQREKKTPSQDR